MDEAVRRALTLDRSATGYERTIEITTIGARSGHERRIETWFYCIGGRFYLTGRPGRRGWYANLRANPACTFHLKAGVEADLPARATPITAESERRRILTEVIASQPDNRPHTADPAEVERWVAGSPLVEVAFDP
jgi:hypothetical protein